MDPLPLPHLKLLSDPADVADDGHNVTIQLVNYQGTGAKIVCRVSASGDLCSYRLKSTDDSGCREQVVSPASQWCARFHHLQVHESASRSKKRKFDELVDAQVDFSQVVFQFKAVDPSSGSSLCEPLFIQFSPQVEEAETNGADVLHSSTSSGLVTGSEDVMLFIRPFSGGGVMVRFFQVDSHRVERWSTFADPCHVYVHHDCAIKFQTPPYTDLDIEQPVEVSFEVVYCKDSRRSERQPFTYLPRRREEPPPPIVHQTHDQVCSNPPTASVGTNISLATRIFVKLNDQLSFSESNRPVVALPASPNDATARLRSLMKMRWYNGNGILHLTLIRRQLRSFGAVMTGIRATGSVHEFVNECNGCDQTPLQLAVLQQLPEAVHLLIASGANPNVLDSKGNAVLHLAASDVKWFNCLRVLLSTKGPIPVRIDQLNCRGQSPLHMAVEACNELATRCLLEHGADLRLKEGTQGQSCLHISVVRRSYEMTQLLLAQRDLDVKAVRFDGRTALDLAETLRYHDVAQLIRRRYRNQLDELNRLITN